MGICCRPWLRCSDILQFSDMVIQELGSHLLSGAILADDLIQHPCCATWPMGSSWSNLTQSTLLEALSVTSFEVNIPRFLSRSGAHSVVGNEDSYFSHITSCAQWNNPSFGYKHKLKKELEIFRRSHSALIREKLSSSNPLYNLASSSLTMSIS